MRLPPNNTIANGDVLAVLRSWPAESVHCVVTSPPYWGLRDYGEEGQGGMEETMEEHIAWIVEVFREARRVLRPDGTLWLNYGDCYRNKQLMGLPWRVAEALKQPYRTCRACCEESHESNWGKVRNRQTGNLHFVCPNCMETRLSKITEPGWLLRQDIIWAKPNPMPESVHDRPANSHEHVFLMSKNARYFYDADAVREGKAESTLRDNRSNDDGHRRERGYPGAASNGGTNLGGRKTDKQAGGRNLRSVWTIPTQPYPGAHFATFPERLVEPCIKAGTSEKGVCPVCGAGWKREVERTPGERTGGHKGRGVGDSNGMTSMREMTPMRINVTTTGWAPGCGCSETNPDASDPVPAIVLDPFAGSGTTGMVAARLGRGFIGIDLAGGDKDLGGHTAHDRIAASAQGRRTDEYVGHKKNGQGDLLDLLEEV